MPPPRLSRVVYRSRSNISHEDVLGLETILRTSVANNRRDKITGCLALPDGHFVQVIEGRKDRVDALLTRIQSDPRHENVTVLGDWPITARLFSGWSMAMPDIQPMSDQTLRVCMEDGGGAQVVQALLEMVIRRDRFFHLT